MKKMSAFQKLIVALNKHKNNLYGYTMDDFDYYNKVSAIWQNLQSPPKRPDGYAFSDGTLLLLEHFEIDATQTKRKGGSEGQRNNDTTEKAIELQLKSSDKAVALEKELRSGEFYVENAIRIFKKHADKIEEYIKALKILVESEVNEVMCGFVIEDASKLGFHETHRNGDELIDISLDIVKSKEFLNLFEETEELDFVLFTTTTYENKGYQVFLSRNGINEAKREAIAMRKVLPAHNYTTTYVIDVPIKLKK